MLQLFLPLYVPCKKCGKDVHITATHDDGYCYACWKLWSVSHESEGLQLRGSREDGSLSGSEIGEGGI